MFNLFETITFGSRTDELGVSIFNELV